MNFRSVVKPYKASFALGYTDHTVWLGSCFTEAIGARAFQRKMPAFINPFGNIFNPLSLALHLQRSMQLQPLQEHEMVQWNNLWNSWHHHSSKSHADKDVLMNNTLQIWLQCGLWLKKAKTLFITFGAAWVYEYMENGLLVANCHKIPNVKFRKRLLSVAEIVNTFEDTLKHCKSENQHLQVVFTVSPVKHLRDGITENNLSKATLLLAAHELCKRLDYVSYFPAYELVTDDLRDYRFYKQDLAHPNEQAEQYVWEYFCDTFFTSETKALMNELESVISGLNHKPHNAKSPSHQTFLNTLLQQAKELQSLGIDMAAETQNITKHLL